MKKLVLSFIGVFVLGFLLGQASNQNLLPLTRMALYENLAAKLQKQYPVTEEELGQGQHLAAVYMYGTYFDVLKWYYQTKWEHSK